jgi:hypothetical protein
VSKIAKSHFFSILESPAYISANRVGNFFYIEKRHFFYNYLIKFPTHFPDRYDEWQIFQGSKLLQRFCVQKSVICAFKKLFTFCSGFWYQKCPYIEQIPTLKCRALIRTSTLHPYIEQIPTLKCRAFRIEIPSLHRANSNFEVQGVQNSNLHTPSLHRANPNFEMEGVQDFDLGFDNVLSRRRSIGDVDLRAEGRFNDKYSVSW